MRVHTSDRGPGRVLLSVSGELDLASADELRLAADDALAAAAPDTLELDLSEVTFIDSTGIGALVGIRNVTAGRGATLQIVDAAPSVRRLLEIANLDTVFELGDR